MRFRLFQMQVWNLAPDQTHYTGITRVMYLRENLREYVWQLSAETAATGMPIVRPMTLQWPEDAVCGTSEVEGQFMLGPDWLVAPVTTYGVTNWTVYLPGLPSNETWVYWWNQSVAFGGSSGQWATIPTPIDEFPLFSRVPALPPSPPTVFNVTVLFSSSRLDSVSCLAAMCYEANAPGTSGDYVAQSIEGVGVTSAPGSTVTINGQAYAIVPLNLCYSAIHNDNYIATNATCPDSTYNVSFSDGFILSEPAPGSVPLQVGVKRSLFSWDWVYLGV